MVRLSFDEAAWDKGLRTMPLDAETQHAIEAALQDRLVAAVKTGVDIRPRLQPGLRRWEPWREAHRGVAGVSNPQRWGPATPDQPDADEFRS